MIENDKETSIASLTNGKLSSISIDFRVEAWNVADAVNIDIKFRSRWVMLALKKAAEDFSYFEFG